MSMPSPLLPEITLPGGSRPADRVARGVSIDQHSLVIARTGGRTVDVRTQKITRDQITVCLNMDSGTVKVVNVQP